MYVCLRIKGKSGEIPVRTGHCNHGLCHGCAIESSDLRRLWHELICSQETCLEM